jgi:hypothetical protein
LNTREIKSWLSDIAFKRLCFAVLLSALLHLLLIGKLGFFELPKPEHAGHLIEARLVKLSHAPGKVEVKPKKVMPKKPEPKPAPEKDKVLVTPGPEVLDKLPPPYVPIEMPEETPAQESAAASDVESTVQSETTVSASEDMVGQEETAYVFPEERKSLPYQYIETIFDIYANEDQARAGEAFIVYDAIQGKQYSLKWEVKATGLLSLFYPDLVQTSKGRISEQGLRPDLYHYQFGDDEDKLYSAEFYWSDDAVSLKSSKGEKTEHISKGAQDFLSFMYQFMFVPPLSNMQVTMTNGKRVATYDYTFVGEEQLDLAFANVKTYHIQHAKVDSDDRTDLWLAVDYHYIPVKIRKTEKNGTVITQIATSIKMQDQIEDRTNDPRFITPSGDAPH